MSEGTFSDVVAQKYYLNDRYLIFQSDMDTSEQPGDSRKKASLNAQRFALLSAASKLTNNQVGTQSENYYYA